MRPTRWLLTVGILHSCLAAAALRGGDERLLPITRDVWLSNVGAEADGNNGGSSRLKVKSIQELSLVDFDAASLRGHLVDTASLHLRLAGNEPLRRLTVGSVAAAWSEGTGTNYEPQNGASTFRHRRHPDLPWGDPQSDLTAVILGHGNTLWRMADAFPADQRGWQRVAVDPDVVSACVAGLSHGLVVFDDTGSEWTREGEKFSFRLFPNRFLHSRESGKDNAPYLKVTVGQKDDQPPAAPTDLKADIENLPSGEVRLSWVTPPDTGPAGTLGFHVEINRQAAPRHQIPLAAEPGQRVSMHVRHLGLAPGVHLDVAVRAVDRAGNVGLPAKLSARVARQDAIELVLDSISKRPASSGKRRSWGAAHIAVVDIVDTVSPTHPLRLTPPRDDAYLVRNHLWDADSGRIRLSAARNEHVGFQLLIDRPVDELNAELRFSNANQMAPETRPHVTWGQLLTVPGAGGPVFDPVLPLPEGIVRPRDPRANHPQAVQSLLCEIHIPHAIAAGDYEATVLLSSKGETTKLPVSLTVRPFTLPDFLSFLPEMNCYGLPENERDYYRLAHRHRTVLNRVPYSQRGDMGDGCAPEYREGRFDWSRWDERFGPLLDGTAFVDLPRRGVPLECFYLPLHENWPLKIDPNFNGSYWADEAFTDAYRAAFVAASKEFAEHVSQRGWSDTMFQGFLNNKVDFKRNGWSRGSSPWLLDEPANWHDYWALRWFGRAFHEGVRAANPSANIAYRCDISRPEWQRDSLDDVLDYNVVQGGAFQRYRQLVLDRKRQFGQTVVVYGSTCLPSANHLQPVTWCWNTWLNGADGVVPWQTVGTEQSWKKEEDTSLFYPGRPVGQREPLASVRLKAYLRGQQDTEYLTLCAKSLGVSREQVSSAVLQLMNQAGIAWSGQARGTGAAVIEDAGRVEFDGVRSDQLALLRDALATRISAQPPEPARRLVAFRSPPRVPRDHPTAGGYVSRGEFPPRASSSTAAAPGIASESQSSSAKPAITRTLQGRAVVRDALIDPAAPTKNFGSEPRDNRLARADTGNALLVRFALEGLDLPKQAVIDRATLSVYVWDPSSQGRTKVQVAGLRTAWDEQTVTWTRAAENRMWQGGSSFAVERDAGPVIATTIMEPDPINDVVEPPVEYQVDVTALVRQWQSGEQSNHGLALLPTPDRTIDDGQFSRVQIYASEFRETRYTPKLMIFAHK